MNAHFQPANVGMPPESDAGSIDVGGLLGAVWRAKFLIGLAGVLLGTATYMLVSASAPVYKTFSQIMLDPGQRVTVTEQDLVPQIPLTDAVVASEVAVLNSNLLLERIVRDLGLESMPEFDRSMLPPSLVAVLKGKLKQRLGIVDPPSPAVDPAQAEDMRMAAVVRELQSRLSIGQAGISYVIYITASSIDPVLAAQIANHLADGFIAYRTEQREAAVARATRWLDERAEDMRAQVAKAEDAIAELKSKNLVLEGATEQAATQQLVTLSSQVSDARARRAVASARYEQAKELSDAGDLNAIANIANSSIIVTLLSGRADLQRSIRQDEALYERNDPRLTRSQAALSGLNAQIDQEAKTYVEGLRSSMEILNEEVKNLEESLLETESRALELSKSSIALHQLEREANAVRNVYEGLLARLKETRALEEMNIPDATVVSRADIPARASAPRPGMLGAIATILGMAGVAGIVIARELWRGFFRGSEEIEAATGLPVLAELPRLRGRPEKVLARMAAKPRSVLSERIRDLRSALDMRGESGKGKTIMIGSAFAGEGKTVVTLALAKTESLAGRKVIVVDADLRHPPLRSLVEHAKRSDLAGVLRRDVPYREAIVSLEGSGFDILPAAGKDPADADAVALPSFARLIEALRMEYDLVLIDTPAGLTVSDSRTIALVVDTILLVVRPRRTPARNIQRMLADLGHGAHGINETLRAKVVGLVLTGQDRRAIRRRTGG